MIGLGEAKTSASSTCLRVMAGEWKESDRGAESGALNLLQFDFGEGFGLGAADLFEADEFEEGEESNDDFRSGSGIGKEFGEL